MEITPERLFNARRRFLKLVAGSLVSALLADNLRAAVLKEEGLDFKRRSVCAKW